MLLKALPRITVILIATATALPLAYATGSALPVSNNTSAVKATLPQAATKPLWTELSAAQKLALSPLAGEWDRLPELSKKKWLEIAARYNSMKPDEQARLQERMRDWVKLTPEQRMAARENYAKSTQLPAEKKSAQWQQYQQLSDEEKKRLAAEHEKKKSLTNLSPEAIKNPNPLAPIKLGPKPVIAPKAAVQAAPASLSSAVPASVAAETIPVNTSASPASQPQTK